MSIYEKLAAVQRDLKAPKDKMNKSIGYAYRSCESILESVKPLLEKNKCTIILHDDIEMIGSRYYVKATAHFVDLETSQVIDYWAYAREQDDKKGIDEPQITGTASSYCRKYCLNGLLLIDDTKDPDSDEYRNEYEAKAKTRRDNRAEHIYIAPQKGTENIYIAPQNDAMNDPTVCRHCKKKIMPQKGKDGTMKSPEEISAATGGLCMTCYRAQRVIK